MRTAGAVGVSGSSMTAPTESPPAGEIWITRNGEIGSVKESEFDADTDVRL
jgi:hypothetical protein